MKSLYTFTFLALAAATGMTACSSSKNAQSGPDMYSSGKTKGSDYVTANPNDQYVQMKSQDYDRWSYFDDYNAYDAYYAPAPGFSPYGGFGAGFASPYYGFGYSPFFGPSFGLGLGFGDPYMMWNNYFIWNSWYNPYFYNPYYGGAVMAVGKSPTAMYSTLRPFGTTSYRSGLAHAGVNASGRNVVYRPGMRATTAYNSHMSTRTTRPVNTFRPFNQPGRNYNAPVRSFSPAPRSFGGGTGGGFRPGGFGRH
jgi:hypothetical protein